MKIEYKGIELTVDTVRVDDGPTIRWADIERVLETLPELANKRLGWFQAMAPPAQCPQAVDEIKAILLDLFDKEK